MKEREKDYSYNYLFSVYFFNFKKKKGLAVRSSPHPPYTPQKMAVFCHLSGEPLSQSLLSSILHANAWLFPILSLKRNRPPYLRAPRGKCPRPFPEIQPTDA